VRRLYFGFPARAPGAGLLLLRIAIGTTLVAQAVLFLFQVQNPRCMGVACCLLALASGASLIVGFLTRMVAAIAAALVTSSTLVSPTLPSISYFHNYLLALNIIIVAAAIALLGPGAISLDAVLFGRRKVIIPRSSRSSGM
jgi:uncharacterized membrane protein YphA (DoxX/SURF4 family)